jgi:hypothetical protein
MDSGYFQIFGLCGELAYLPYYSLPSPSSARQPYMGPGLPQKLLPAFLFHCYVPRILCVKYFLNCPVIIYMYNMSCPAQSVYFNISDNVRLIKQLMQFMVVSFPPQTILLHYSKNASEYPSFKYT